MSKREFALTFGESRNQKKWVKAGQFDLLDALSVIGTHQEQDVKDGLCFVPGLLAGHERKAQAVKQIDFLVYDIDGTQLLKGVGGIEQALLRSGAYARVYSSYRHLGTTTEVLVSNYRKWAGQAGLAEDPTLENMQRYLSEHKPCLTNVVFDLADRQKHVTQDSDGTKFVVHHSPAERYRVVLPLLDAIKMIELDLSTPVAIAIFKSYYHGVGTALGLKYDHACEDPSRLYYTAACRQGAVRVLLSFGDCQKLLNYRDYPRAEVGKAKCKPSSGTSKARSNGAKPCLHAVKDKDGVTINLLDWNKHNKADFDLEGLLADKLPPEMIREARSGKPGFHIECPFEEEHSSSGGQGTFVSNGDGDKDPVIYCTHNSCKQQRRGTLDFLAQLIRLGHLRAKDFNSTGYGAKFSVEDAAAAVKDEQGVGPVLDRLADKAPDPLFDDKIIDLLVKQSGRRDRSEYKKVLRAALNKKRQGKHSESDARRPGREERATGTEAYSSAATMLLRSTLLGAGVDGDVVEEGRGLQILHEGTVYTVRDARLLGHLPVVEPACDPVVQFAGLLGDTPIAHLDPEAAFQEQLAPMIDKGATDHERYALSNAIRPDDWANPNLEVLASILSSEDPEMLEVLRLNKDYALVNVGGEPRAYTRKTNQRHSVHSLPLTERRQAKLARRNDKKAKYHDLVKVWLESLYKVQYDGAGLYPLGFTTSGTRYLEDPKTSNHFNFWRGFAVTPAPGNWARMKDHLLHVVCGGNETYFSYILDWLAQRVQRPWEIPGTALVLFGEKGCGKSIFATEFAKVFGPHAEVFDKSHHVVGTFANFAEDKLLVVLEEALFSGDPRHANAAKHMITSNKQTVEKKYEQQYSVNCSPGFIFCSNSDEPVHVTPDERRFFALRALSSRIGDKAYFKTIIDEMNSGGREAMLYELQHRDIETFNAMGDMPYTKHLSEMALRSLKGEDRVLLNALKQGSLADKAWPLDTPLVLEADRLGEAFASMTGRRYDSHSDLTSLGIKLDSWGVVEAKYLRTVDGKRVPQYRLVSLSRARELLAAAWRVDTEALKFQEPEEGSVFDLAREYCIRAAELSGISRLVSPALKALLAEVTAKEMATAAAAMNDDEPCDAHPQHA